MNTTTTISVTMSVQCGPSQMHMEHAQSTQFYAPTKASIKEFRLYPVFILRLFVSSKGVGHYSTCVIFKTFNMCDN